jgi:hypothetical protein
MMRTRLLVWELEVRCRPTNCKMMEMESLARHGLGRHACMHVGVWTLWTGPVQTTSRRQTDRPFSGTPTLDHLLDQHTQVLHCGIPIRPKACERLSSACITYHAGNLPHPARSLVGPMLLLPE